jgi:Mg-chelatase subunit ChlI
VLPFAALVGQGELKRALTMLAVNPKLGGVLIRGEKGTAKSTAARGLAGLLPPIRVNAGCRFACSADERSQWCDACRGGEAGEPVERAPPFETLPLGITEDQLLGTLDLEVALRHGEVRFAPGLLARVSQGVLYVDEVNLLEDHVVDLLLDTAASGINIVAREGVSFSHPARFVLVGTMNPEEGELRPQLLDRFGLCVEVSGLSDLEERADVVERQLAFERDPEAFAATWQAEERSLAAAIATARRVLPEVRLDRSWFRVAAQVALELEVHGHRSDLLLIKGAATLAALAGRAELSAEDLAGAATVVLPHRLRRQPFEEPVIPRGELVSLAAEIIERASGEAQKKNEPGAPVSASGHSR